MGFRHVKRPIGVADVVAAVRKVMSSGQSWLGHAGVAVSVFRVAADLVVALHAAFALFVALGALLAFRWRRVMWAHMPATAWGVLIEFSGWVCPLTPLENALRLRAGEAAYSGDFIQHYVVPALYPANLTHETQLAIGSAALLGNVLIYGCLFHRRGHAR